MRIAVYPGSFDPITNGHMDIITRASSVFDIVIVAVVKNPGKNPLFTMEERVKMIEKASVHLGNIKVKSFSGLLVDFVKIEKAQVIIRGLRAISDFENEFQMALMNKNLYRHAETFFLASHTDYAFLSSSMVKEVASFGGDVQAYVPSAVWEQLKIKYR
ncbi:pantetheine-phosphate adenylyltransferase [Heliorestis acidaminivorans]|uniref:Phosphopantetheine adenylyltransferase n=1 Tax=Heliorestis acidaminivorans TaxID=553427 RepID=A0A6I0EVM5_9FIRM|nr:pantetheine-phosphate adenylyltransferase [Heliorestis acidaminivorans]KAB2954454.1 pantetheine-phosphate adenylyltransferase [Heliorestis acidaminivorans]